MPRIAYFPDSFHEVNGVAHTSRNFQAYAVRHNIPFLCVRALLTAERGQQPIIQRQGELTTVDLPRSAAKFRLERDLHFDALFLRHRQTVLRELRNFHAEVIHITGPSDVGILGAWAARTLHIPLVMGWHTNLHEYAGRRITNIWPLLMQHSIGHTAENITLAATLRFYRLAQVIFAPNPELVSLLARSTGKPTYLMERGLDTELFSPARRTRPFEDGRLVLGYVGRLSSEKNILALVTLERTLAALGVGVEFLIVGHGMEEDRLRAALPNATFAGVLRGAPLAEANANMDLFVFPSETDTFGNVVLEALASGVPALVTPRGGPKFLVEEGITGFVSEIAKFQNYVARFAAQSPLQRQKMRDAARQQALKRSWDAVFTEVLSRYPVQP